MAKAAHRANNGEMTGIPRGAKVMRVHKRGHHYPMGRPQMGPMGHPAMCPMGHPPMGPMGGLHCPIPEYWGDAPMPF
jgi:hypothetical protein